VPLYSPALLALAVFSAGPSSAQFQVETGSCVARGGPPPPVILDGPPFDLKASPYEPAEAEYWELLGLRVDKNAGRLIASDGRFVPAAEVERLRQPVDASKDALDASLWGGIAHSGYRLDEKTCRFFNASGAPFYRLMLEGWRASYKKSYGFMALENLKVRLAELPADQPISKETVDHMRALSQAGVELPPNVRELLFGSRAPNVGQMSGAVDAAYAEATRYFDAARGFKGIAASAFAVIDGLNEPGRRPTYIQSDEKKLGDLIAAEFEESFSKTPAGREMIEHFRGKDGKVKFPEIMVLKLTQRPGDPHAPGAVLDSGTGAVTLSHWMAARLLLEQVPPREKAARAREFSDAALLRRYLVDHPEARRRLIGSIDDVFLHEFVHAWQNRRDQFDAEMARDNIPSSNPLPKEYEAHREQCRYLNEKLLRDPAGTISSPYLDRCLPLLGGYEPFRHEITRLYMSKFAGSQELPDVQKRQRERESTARRLMGEGAYQWALQKLKLLGLARGDRELEAFAADARRREENFTRETLPRLQDEAAVLPRRLAAAGRPDLGLKLMLLLPRQAAKKAGGEKMKEQMLSKTIAWLGKPGDSRLEDRLAAYGGVFKRLEAKKSGWPVDLMDSYGRDVRLYVKERLAEAAATRDFDVRRSVLASARSVARVLPDEEREDALRRIEILGRKR